MSADRAGPTARVRFTTAAGVVAPALILVTVGAGAATSRIFDWPTDPFSVVGSTGTPVAVLFNAGLVLGGVLGLVFADRLWRAWNPLLGAFYAVIGLSFVVAGVFPIGSGLHDVAAGVFLFTPLASWTAGALDWRAGRRYAALASFGLGDAAVAVWLPYDVGMAWAQVGYGAAELVTVLALATWSGWTAYRLWSTGSLDDG